MIHSRKKRKRSPLESSVLPLSSSSSAAPPRPSALYVRTKASIMPSRVRSCAAMYTSMHPSKILETRPINLFGLSLRSGCPPALSRSKPRCFSSWKRRYLLRMESPSLSAGPPRSRSGGLSALAGSDSTSSYSRDGNRNTSHCSNSVDFFSAKRRSFTSRSSRRVEIISIRSSRVISRNRSVITSNKYHSDGKMPAHACSYVPSVRLSHAKRRSILSTHAASSAALNTSR
mmetsp:Transcript_30712/g.80397  ORF Transcript_30712/g.80397 Transcript_30712/m.80397 type:complete len:230 (-) Transcript_30712:877-1566(-)